jgi:predicted O-linked N-acetylglucosamine transferase (SPINDLY family)
MRPILGLRGEAIVYLCCQSYFKYLPQYDYLLAAIAQAVPQAQFAFLPHPSPLVSRQFWERLERAFQAYGLDWANYGIIVPRCNKADYRVADIFLDTLDWSGGNTALEAIACGLPIVIRPGQFMRGRHSYGMLKRMGVTETIAQDEKEYIEIAIRLGKDEVWRKQVREKVQQNTFKLYDDQDCVRALEEFYLHATGE